MAVQQNAEKVQTLDRALKILDSLMETTHPLGVNEISKMHEINPSAAHRILKTLQVNGWVYQCENDKYILGEKIAFVTEKDNFYMALSEVAYYVMKQLTEREGFPMNLVVKQRNKYFILQQTRTTRLADYVPPIGTSLPLHASAGGKILLCELPASLQKQIVDTISLEMMTPHTICKKKDFFEELERVKNQGYALDYHESIEGCCCVGVPVRGKSREIIAALSFSGITGITSKDQLLYYLPLLKEASQEISRRLFTLQEEYAQE